MNKNQLLEKYSPARQLRGLAPLAQWREVFPTRESLIAFWEESKAISWPENYGQSPLEAAQDVAANLANGLTDSTVAFYASQLAKGCEYMAHKIAILSAYGFDLPEELRPSMQEHYNAACARIDAMAESGQMSEEQHERATDKIDRAFMRDDCTAVKLSAIAEFYAQLYAA